MHEGETEPTPEEVYKITIEFLLVIVTILFILFLLMLLKRRRRIKEDVAFERGQAEIVKKTAIMIQQQIDQKISQKFAEVLRNNQKKAKPFMNTWQDKARKNLEAAAEGEGNGETSKPLNPIFAALNMTNISKEEPLIHHESSNNQDSSVPATGLNESRYGGSSSSSTSSENE